VSSDRRKRRKRRAAGVVLALAVALLAAGAATLVHTMRFVQGAERTTGTVIDLSEDFSSDDGTVHTVVRFTSAEGRTVEFRSSTGSSSPPDVGDRVDVLYDPDDPQDAELSGFFDLWLWAIALGGLGIAFTTFALLAPGFGLFGQSRLARYLGRLATRAKEGET
jgi:hypothetical protein